MALTNTLKNRVKDFFPTEYHSSEYLHKLSQYTRLILRRVSISTVYNFDLPSSSSSSSLESVGAKEGEMAVFVE